MPEHGRLCFTLVHVPTENKLEPWTTTCTNHWSNEIRLLTYNVSILKHFNTETNSCIKFCLLFIYFLLYIFHLCIFYLLVRFSGYTEDSILINVKNERWLLLECRRRHTVADSQMTAMYMIYCSDLVRIY